MNTDRRIDPARYAASLAATAAANRARVAALSPEYWRERFSELNRDIRDVDAEEQAEQDAERRSEWRGAL